MENELSSYEGAVEELQKALRSDPRQIETSLVKAFMTRDRVENTLQSGTETDRLLLPRLVSLDKQLYDFGRKALDAAKINLPLWRQTYPNSANLQWWWKIDDPLVYGGGGSQAGRELIIQVLAVLCAGIALTIIAVVTQRLFAGGLDWLGGISAAAQLILGGGLASSKGRELIDRVSQYFPRIQGVNSGRLLLGSVIFLGFTVLVNFVFLPFSVRLMYQIASNAMRQGSLADAQAYLGYATQWDPSFAPGLVSMGSLYEAQGDVANAKQVYQAAVQANSHLVYAHYRLAAIYIDEGDHDRALALLDSAINYISSLEDPLVAMPQESTENETAQETAPEVTDQDRQLQLEYLLRITRARAWLAKCEPLGAQFELTYITARLVRRPSHAFGIETGQLPLTQLDYLKAQVLDELAELNNRPDFRVQAIAIWSEIAKTGNRQGSSTERAWVVEASQRQEEPETTCAQDQGQEQDQA